jgi:hypothetical protein
MSNPTKEDRRRLSSRMRELKQQLDRQYQQNMELNVRLQAIYNLLLRMLDSEAMPPGMTAEDLTPEK